VVDPVAEEFYYVGGPVSQAPCNIGPFPSCTSYRGTYEVLGTLATGNFSVTGLF
jgi:hypothetical protein